ncbi:MAG TPA: IPT/TIG domain-containing protein [Candidatus Saccharimonadales bacterium]|nr:IPT/TIG domain-containing protein [Candidatus Saccharimonadales bacterium]
MGRAGQGNCTETGPVGHRGTVRRRRGVGGTATRVAIAAIGAIALLALTAAGASAVVRHLAHGKTVSYQPLRSVLAQPLLLSPAAKKQSPLLYHGGPIMSSNSNYAFYWAPEGSPAYASGYQEGIDLYFERLAHDSGGHQNVDSVAAQYNDSAGDFAEYNSHFAGAIIDTNPYPANGCHAATICLTDEQLQAELKSYIKAHSLPTDLNHEYFILTPPGVESCFEEASVSCSAGSSSPEYCAYHGFITVASGVVIYADDPYTTGVTGCDTGEHPSESPAEGTIQGGLSHEHNESITDPEISAWTDASGAENGDKCRTFEPISEFGTALGKAPDGAPYNQVIDGGLYYYQQEFSNETRNCQQRLTPPAPTVKKLAPKHGPAAGGTTVTITGTGFEKGATVKFGLLEAKEVTFLSTSSLTAVSPEEAPGKVGVTVTTVNGTSAVAGKSSFTFKKAKK